MNELTVTSESIIDLLLDDDKVTQETVEEEYEEAQEYRNKFLAAQVRMANRTQGKSTPVSICMEEDSSFKLPKIEPTKFDGEVNNWLKFWSYFKNVDEKPKLSKEEKFQYLLKAMVPGSKADLLVSSYPPTEENYDKAIESLKARFGREDLQTEFYMREL